MLGKFEMNLNTKSISSIVSQRTIYFLLQILVTLQIKEVAAIFVGMFDVSENIREKFFPDVKSNHLLKTNQSAFIVIISSLDFLILINL